MGIKVKVKIVEVKHLTISRQVSVQDVTFIRHELRLESGQGLGVVRQVEGQNDGLGELQRQGQPQLTECSMVL